MNRYREDTRYVFRPPKYSPVFAPVVYAISDVFFLRRRHKVVEVKVVSGGEEFLVRHGNGDSLLVAPNHSDHCDPHVLLHLGRKYSIPIHFMAAREIFEKKLGIHGSILQRAGVFSIDREGSDLKSIKEAMRILSQAGFPLVMFPEGEIYHMNERLTPLNEGAASLALRAARKMRKEKRGKSVFIVPTAIRYPYTEDISPTFPDRLSALERRITWQPQSHLDVVDRIYKFGEAVLALKEKEHLGRVLCGELAERLSEFREILIGEAEEEFFSEVRTENHPTRVRRRRAEVTFCDPVNLNDHLEELDRDSHAAAAAVTSRVESAIRSVLEAQA